MMAALGIIIKTSVLLSCVAVIASFLRRASASVRHALWAIGLLAVLTFPLVSRILPKWNIAVLPPATDFSQFDTTPLSPQPADRAESIPGSGPPRLPVQASHSEPHPTAMVQRFVLTGNQAFALLWILGSAFVILGWAHSLWKLRQLTGCASPAAGALQDAFADVQQWIGVRGAIALRVSESAIPPMTWGIFRRVILLPAASIEWSAERLRLVLAHELAHIRRNDGAGQILAQAVCCLYWFNPLVWYAIRRLHAERERACDDYVLRLGAVDADYADHLLQITRGLNSGFRRGAVSMADPSQLKARLLAILDSRMVRSRASRFTATSLLTIVGVLTLSIAAIQVTALSTLAVPAATRPLGLPISGLVRQSAALSVAAVLEPPVELQQATSASAEEVFVEQYCVRCHNSRDAVGGLSFDGPRSNGLYAANTADIAHAADNRDIWEKTIRRLQIGTDPYNEPKPPAAASQSLIRFLETQLDSNAKTYLPPIGPHRLNRTEYVNSIRDLLDLEFDSDRLLPRDDSTAGFDNIAAVLDSPRARTAYSGLAPVLSRLALEATANSPSRLRIFSCTVSYRDAGGPAACYRRIIATLTENAFRGYATAADVDGFVDVFNSAGGNERGLEAALAQILASPKFLFRSEEAPAGIQTGDAFRISDRALASRLSYFLWSSGPDEELLNRANDGTLHNPPVLEQQTLRMLKDPRAEALSVNFGGQWLGYRFLAGVAPISNLFPEFDSDLRTAMQREGELFFDSLIREDRSVVDFLDSGDTFVNNRLAHLYGIPNITGSAFRRITLPAALDARRGILGKAFFLTVTSRNNRTSPVSRAKWILTNLLDVPPPDPPPDVPQLHARTNDPSFSDPSMRRTMEDHRTVPVCAECHRWIDPIGFSLENFNAIGSWRSDDGGLPVDVKVQLPDGRNINGPSDIRNWLMSHSDLFIQQLTQKLMIYALGRRLDPRDMPVVRTIDRSVAQSNNRFSAIVLGIVKSDTFQMNSK